MFLFVYGVLSSVRDVFPSFVVVLNVLVVLRAGSVLVWFRLALNMVPCFCGVWKEWRM